jgi:hypothetical protein
MSVGYNIEEQVLPISQVRRLAFTATQAEPTPSGGFLHMLTA